jgi:hypothetical protein
MIWRRTDDKVREIIRGIHCFDMTGALPILQILEAQLHKKYFKGVTKDDRCPPGLNEFWGNMNFAPAPKTWLEYTIPEASSPRGLLVEDLVIRQQIELDGRKTKMRRWARVYDFIDTAWLQLCFMSLEDELVIPFVAAPQNQLEDVRKFLDSQPDHIDVTVIMIRLMLAAINTPRMLGHEVHDPNRGLVRRAETASKRYGEFKLHPWHEIKLELLKPRDIDDGEPHSDVIRGKRALHFCRKHIRVRLGKLEYVRAHWRGDASLGVKPATYRVTA